MYKQQTAQVNSAVIIASSWRMETRLVGAGRGRRLMPPDAARPRFQHLHIFVNLLSIRTLQLTSDLHNLIFRPMGYKQIEMQIFDSICNIPSSVGYLVPTKARESRTVAYE